MQNFNFLIPHFALLSEIIRLSLSCLVDFVYEIVAATMNPTAEIIAIRSTARHREFFGNIPSNFKTVSLAELAPSEQKCRLCRRSYEAEIDPQVDSVENDAAILIKAGESSAVSSETPVRLSCGHIFGSECITRRFALEEGEGHGKDSCSTCGQVIYIVNILPWKWEFLDIYDGDGKFRKRLHYIHEFKEWVERKGRAPYGGRIWLVLGCGFASSGGFRPMLESVSQDWSLIYKVRLVEPGKGALSGEIKVLSADH